MQHVHNFILLWELKGCSIMDCVFCGNIYIYICKKTTAMTTKTNTHTLKGSEGPHKNYRLTKWQWKTFVVFSKLFIKFYKLLASYNYRLVLQSLGCAMTWWHSIFPHSDRNFYLHDLVVPYFGSRGLHCGRIKYTIQHQLQGCTHSTPSETVATNSCSFGPLWSVIYSMQKKPIIV